MVGATTTEAAPATVLAKIPTSRKEREKWGTQAVIDADHL
jgi:hypothetical protein